MAYFDNLLSTYFNTTPDGRKLFYPLGAMGVGYVVPSEQEEKRLRQFIKTYYIAALVLIGGSYPFLGNLGAIVIGLAFVIFYLLYKPRLVRGLQPTTERMSVSTSVAKQSRIYSAWMLWSMEIFMLALCGIAVAMLFDETVNRLASVGMVALFGTFSAMFAWMIVMRRRASA